MIKQAFRLWQREPTRKGSTLQRRLILFFALVIVGILLLLLLLLTAFGIMGSGHGAVKSYTEIELAHLSDALKTDFGNLSVSGIALSETLSERSDDFLSQKSISVGELADNPELIEPLLSVMMPELLSVSQSNSCGGVFVLLDAAVNQSPESAGTAKAGLFFKRTQPVSSGAVRGSVYCLRGPASVARRFGVELLGQWKMEYDIAGQDFFNKVMETARAHPGLPISRLYYWSERVTLKDDSEAGFLLCVPLRSGDGTVFGVCGISVSQRMFSQLYSPQDNRAYPNVTTIVAPFDALTFHAEGGLVGGSALPSRRLLSGKLAYTVSKNGFVRYCGESGIYGGLAERITVYPKASPYADERLYAAVVMPDDDLQAAVSKNMVSLLAIVLILLVCSITASVFISRRYLRPLSQMFDTVKSKKEADGEFKIPEIDEFFELLAQQSREQLESLNSAEIERQKAEKKYASAQKLIEQLSADKLKGFDPERYEFFCAGIKKLTKTQREIFSLYLDGHSMKEVREIREYTTNALKWHNREIYGKLGVSSLKELMVYAPVIKSDMERGAAH